MKLGITFYFEEEMGGVLVVEDGGATPLLKDDVVLGCSYAKQTTWI